MTDSGLLQLQRQFARDIRTGGEDACTEQPNMQIYRDLFFNNVCGFLDGGFPVCMSILGEERWRQVCRNFFRDHECATPYFLKISEEFLTWFSVHSEAFPEFPYLAELAHYEWLELAVDVMDTEEQEKADPDADLMESVPVFPAAVAAAAYNYPVHLASESNSALEPLATGLILFRDENDKVRFIHCNLFTLTLFERLRSTELSAGAAVEALLRDSGMAPSVAAVNGAAAILRDWQSQGLILGGQLSL
ncbi:MAG TPA: hypothetical protein DEA26_09060 [Oceanospirillales bacterium]|nr:hypothetical protein [Oceanospirillaceae bacterium]HBS42816.1 hypothetical protein [Oceanospirillales bacterium]